MMQSATDSLRVDIARALWVSSVFTPYIKSTKAILPRLIPVDRGAPTASACPVVRVSTMLLSIKRPTRHIPSCAGGCGQGAEF